MAKQKQLEKPTTPTGFEAWFVEWGRTGARRRGTVVATRADAAAEWVWIQPRLKELFEAAPTSRRPFALTVHSRVICVVAQEQSMKDGRETWQEVVDEDRPRFAAPKVGALEPLKAPYKPRAARTTKAGASRLNTGGAL